MRKTLCLILAAALLLCLTPGAAAETATVELRAPSAILMDAATGTVLFEKNADERREPASVTKIMTLLLVMEALEAGQIGWEDRVTASAAAAGKGGSQIYLEEGEQLSMDEMLKSVTVSSANDCATALAEHVAGSEAAFVGRMNARAAELGMTNTRFVNCTGLDDEPEAREHLTTARDVAIMSRELLKHDAIRRYTTIWTDSVRGGAFGLSNTNKLVRFYQGTTGLKTGYTSRAGHCLSASASRDGIELIAVVLGADSSSHRFEDAKALLNWGFANYTLIRPDDGIQPEPIPVTLGTLESVTPLLESPDPILLEKSKAAAVKRELELPERLEAPVEAGQTLGTLRVKAGDQLLAELPLTAAEPIPRLRFGQIWLKLLLALAQ
ncbi:MAG: D-alanyl-D-alanine carboxypeptidase [Oscillospiraceae bacterium]|nr:D-alanyl-D-alanine carboxypeptidase [Oscillospiraceae bacterium]MBR7009579.1 D-alanyl-D-alanine carboxypeptidase [Oscillospiraceae bacterium]